MELYEKSLNNIIIYFISLIIVCIILLFKNNNDIEKEKNKKVSKMTKIFAIIFTCIIVVVLPLLDLLFCLQIKNSKSITKDINIISLEKEILYVLMPSKRRHLDRCEIFKVVSSNNQEYYICNEELEQSLKVNNRIINYGEIEYVKTFRGDFILEFEPKI